MTSFHDDVQKVCALAREKAPAKGRTVIGIAGPPASGKSTLAEAVVDSLNYNHHSSIPAAALVPMDGYHLDNEVLRSRGLLSRKGAPETFDAHGFCDAVRRLHDTSREVFFPRFDRKMDLSVAGAISVHPETPIVVVEGNYLLLNTCPWASLNKVVCASVFVSPSSDVLRARLVKRWIDHGLSATDALERANGNDLPNAELILANSLKADLVLQQADLDKPH